MWGDVKQNLFGKYMFCMTCKDSSLGPKISALKSASDAIVLYPFG